MLSPNPTFVSRRFRIINKDFTEVIQDGLTWTEMETRFGFAPDSPESRQLYMLNKNRVITFFGYNVIRTR